MAGNGTTVSGQSAVQTRFAGLSDTGKTRSQNQDAIYLPEAGPEQSLVFVLADGMGGANGGEVASRLAVEGIPAGYALARQTLDAEDSLRQAVSQAAVAIHGRAQEQPELKGMGTTVVVLALERGRALMANVGDSRGYLWREGHLMQVTQDHSLVQQMVAQGSLSAQEARHHHLRNVLTRVLGNAPRVEVDIFDLALAPGDILLMCSDGLHGLVEDREIGQILATPAGLPEQASALVELANRRGGPDNISVILVVIDDLGAGPGENTVRRTRAGLAPAAPAAPGRPRWLPWLALLILAGVAGGAYLWLNAGSPPAPAGPGQVLLAPVGPTSDSQLPASALPKQPAPDQPPSAQDKQP